MQTRDEKRGSAGENTLRMRSLGGVCCFGSLDCAFIWAARDGLGQNIPTDYSPFGNLSPVVQVVGAVGSCQH